MRRGAMATEISFALKRTQRQRAHPSSTADSSLTFVFDVTLSSGTFEGYSPNFKIDWVGSQTQYDLVGRDLTITQTPIPGALPLFAGGGALLGFLGWRRKRKAIATA